MLSEVDVFISNYTLVDPEIYQLWVDGSSSSEAVNTLNQRGICQQTNAPIELVASDVLDHYRTYSLLERLLQMPLQLACEQLAFQIEPQTSQMLIEIINIEMQNFLTAYKESIRTPGHMDHAQTCRVDYLCQDWNGLLFYQFIKLFVVYEVLHILVQANTPTSLSKIPDPSSDQLLHVWSISSLGDLISKLFLCRCLENLVKLFKSSVDDALSKFRKSHKPHFIVDRYYEFDDAVVRDFLGKKLSAKHRKELDEVAEKTGVSLKSCRRQFDNVKRVLKAIEDLPGSLAANIKQYFILPEELAKRYAAVVFLACMRFEMNKKKLQYLTFPDLFHCANTMMALWTYRFTGSEYFDTDLDREFLLDLPECRVLLDNDKHHKHLVCIKLKPTLLERSYQELDMNFRSYSRAIIGIACNLHRSRELRSFFLELVERCLEPWRQVNWSHTDLRNFLSAYTQCGLDMDVLREADLKNTFDRYMKVVTSCLLRMYRP